MVRDTSKNAYYEIKNNGLLSERRWMVYDCLYNNGPMTGGEIFEALRFGRANANITSRLSELRRMGVAVEIGTKECASTGMTVTLWDVTSKLPEKLEPTLTKKQKKDKALKGLRELYASTVSVLIKKKINGIANMVKDI